MIKVYIGVGSNCDAEQNIRSAIQTIKARFGSVKVSNIYKNASVKQPGQAFFNLVIAFDTHLDIDDLIQYLKSIENQQQRDRSHKERCVTTLDLDLLLYGDYEGSIATGELPRPECLTQSFILCPLAEVAGKQQLLANGDSYQMRWELFDQQLHPLKKVHWSM